MIGCFLFRVVFLSFSFFFNMSAFIGVDSDLSFVLQT